MYSTREKLIHFNQLVNPQAVEADLALLHKKNPQSTDFVRFDHAPEKNSEDILFALLDVCEHRRNRAKSSRIFLLQKIKTLITIQEVKVTVLHQRALMQRTQQMGKITTLHQRALMQEKPKQNGEDNDTP